MSDQPIAVIVESADGGFAQTVTSRGHTWAADEPVELAGTDTGPDALRTAALGTRGVHVDYVSNVRSA